MALLVAATAILLLWWVQWYAWPFYRNYRVAKRTGLPLIVCPISADNVLWIILNQPLRPLMERCLPAVVLSHFRTSAYGWEFRDKHKLIDEIGTVFLVCNPADNEIWSADPALSQLILARRKDFLTVPVAKTIMGFLGKNVLISDGDDWARQRRLVAPNLNERISEVVWKETRVQATAMSEFMLKQPGGESRDSVSALRTIAINVLSKVGYGQSKEFRIMELPSDPEAKITYPEAIALCTELLILAALVPVRLLRLPVMPKLLQTLGAALEKLPGLTKDMLEQERQEHSSADARDNIMSMLVRLSDQGKLQDGGQTKESAQYLTEDEIAGNMFIFTAAGFDTTSNTMAYAMTLLAAYPQWQAWIHDEVDPDFASLKDGESLDYAATFPKLARCLALMFEILRLFPPVVHLVRGMETAQNITYQGRHIALVPPIKFYINIPGLHHAPASWGERSTEFDPSRWIETDPTTGAERVVPPARGTFAPWSSGPRLCPGQKMSQVEFVMVMATLLSKCKVEAVPKEGESAKQARQRLVDLTQQSEPRLTLQMPDPKQVNLRWTRR